MFTSMGIQTVEANLDQFRSNQPQNQSINDKLLTLNQY